MPPPWLHRHRYPGVPAPAAALGTLALVTAVLIMLRVGGRMIM